MTKSRGLSRLYQETGEDIATYYIRARIEENQVVEAYKSENNCRIAAAMRTGDAKASCKAFVFGLKEDIDIKMKEAEDLSRAGPGVIDKGQRLSIKENLRSMNLTDTCAFCEKPNRKTKTCPLLQEKETI